VTFGALCRDCLLRAACTTAKAGRTMVLHERDDLLRAARADWAADPALREDYRTYRPNIERTVSQVATHSGRRIKLRYHGTTKNNAWLKCRTAALNPRNLLGRALTRVDRTWSWPPDRPQRPGTEREAHQALQAAQPRALPPHTCRARPDRDHPPPALSRYRAQSGRHHRTGFFSALLVGVLVIVVMMWRSGTRRARRAAHAAARVVSLAGHVLVTARPYLHTPS
jgi:Transposase DDE domain